ncbi:hypothetical protein [Geodermatophilus ruber]|uniref:Lipoprotein LpqN n=1 Tax=Geodermatophilus ruber TaxID=504800 RepID=A0A1I4L5J3_9ACTN|nr:hypothetical protein [Geodermatophilus ruber]SFL86264.1 hypothetical protein SAMN04488085_12028 [Geodermatophilus ruber]
MTHTRSWIAVPVTVATLLVAGCGPGAPGAPGAAGGPASASESNPLGDIPDNQVYVVHPSPDGRFSVQVPEGWARTDLPDGVSFTDKLNTVTVQELTGRPQPTPDSVRTDELTVVADGLAGVAVGDVTAAALPSGPALHATWSADSAPDPVTGRTVRDDVETFVFWRDGTEVLLTLSGPKGADNVDPWRQISQSFAWT